MAIGANSYGSVAGVGALTPKFSGAAQDFASTTRPTLAQLEIWINQVSAYLNVALSDEGFEIPISQADSKLMLDSFVDDATASLVEGINGSGKFGPQAMNKKSMSVTRFDSIRMEAAQFIEDNALGLERLGATRTYSQTSGMAFRSTDKSGDATSPLFQREQYGEGYPDSDV